MTEPASIRYKNPGAMWGSALAIKWGASPKAVTLNDGKGQGNNIAVFPTYVAGICAQLDLWRSSKHYRNKRFCDAIAIWSGHNNVASYIAFCKKRVPGLTESTIMNDAFWQSPSGIAFLKAQAWHEAGKKYPAPDADWIEAQRRVFDDDAASAPRINVQPQKAPYSLEVEVVQRNLDKLGYHEVGDVDGKWGGKTKGAMTAFLNDRHLDIVVNGGPTPATNQAISAAIAEGWTRPIATTRANATAKDIAPKVEAVRQSLWQRFVAKITGAGAGGVAVVTGVGSQFGAVNDQISPIKEFFANVPGWAWFAIIAAAALALWLSSNKATVATTNDYNTGKIN